MSVRVKVEQVIVVGWTEISIYHSFLFYYLRYGNHIGLLLQMSFV